MMRKALLSLAAATAIFSSIIYAAPTIKDAPSGTEGKAEAKAEETSAETPRGPIAIDLLTDLSASTTLAPGEEVTANARIRNVGTDPAHIFVEVTDPRAEGAITLDGESDPHVIEFEAGEGWEEVADGVYFYEEVLRAGEETKPLIHTCAIPNYELTNGGDEVMTGTIPMEEVQELLSTFNIQGYSIQGSLKGTGEELWRMVKGE